MYLKTRGLVLRVTNFNDTDAFLTILSGEYGKLTVKARGLRRKNSPLIAPCQLLSYGEFSLFEYRDTYSVNEAHSIELFEQLRRDLDKLSLGTYFSQVADVVSQEDMPNPELLSLLLNCLYALARLPISENQVKAVFELRCACLAGYTPDLTSCYQCGTLAPTFFDISQGHLVCSSCGGTGPHGIRMPFSAGTLDAMRYICGCDPKKLFSFSASSDTLEELAHITETYLTTQLERGFSALDFYKSLRISL